MHRSPSLRQRRPSAYQAHDASDLVDAAAAAMHLLPPLVPFSSPLAPVMADRLDTILIFIDIPTVHGTPTAGKQPWLASKDCTLSQLASEVASVFGVRVWDIRLFYNGYRYGWSEEVKIGAAGGSGLGMKERDVVYVLLGGGK